MYQLWRCKFPSFYEALELAFGHFLKYHMKIFFGDFSGKVGREDIFKPTIGSVSLHKTSNADVTGAVNFATSKYLLVKSAVFPYCKIHKFTCTSNG
jgi:hypothetical protein